jgi:environmental stress-induced protein Ves
MTLQVLRASDRATTPWKNGGGVTSQIAIFPETAGVSDFDWRVSLAMVAAAGPFSAFPGVDRLMMVLEGRLELEIPGADPLVLDAGGPAAEFPGDAPVSALAPASPVADINVMVRRGRFTASLERRRIAGSAAVVSQDVTLILSSVGGLSAATGAATGELGPGDVARIDAARGALVRLRSAEATEVVVVHINAVR